MGELYAVNADGTGKATMAGFRVKGEWVFADMILPPHVADGKVLIARYHWNGSNDGSYPTAVRMDIKSSAEREVAVAPIRNAAFVADNDGEVRFAYADGTDHKRRVYHRLNAGAAWELVFDESRGDPRVRPRAFTRDNRQAWFECAGSHGVGGLCRWNVETRKLVTLWSSEVSELEGLLRSFDRKDVVALRSVPGRGAITLVDKDAPESKLLVTLMQQFPGEDVQIANGTTDGSKVVFLVSSGRDPGRYYLYDAGEHKASFLLARRPWIDPQQMGAVEPVTLKARDGLALHGYLTTPPGKEGARQLPMVVYVHGGPYGVRDYWEFDPNVQMLASRGHAVLQVNFRGSGGYGDAFMKAGFNEWGAKMQDDVTDATRWAIAQGIADPKRICIFGGSYGGYAALQGVVKEPDLYQCAIGYVGVYDLNLMYTRGDIPQSMYGDNYLKMVLGEDQAVLRARSPVANVGRIKAKLMLIVGGQDKRVPPVQGQALRSALNKARIEHEWLYQRAEGHGFYDEGNTEDMLGKIEAFLDRSIGEPSQ
jgi:dipeptidyl aminopeptidase/acylaminoacyl peptidase